MKVKNSVKILVAILLLIAFLSIVPSTSAETVVNFNYTGNVQTWEVPSGVTEIEIEAWGAQGGSGSYYGTWGYGGKGGYAYGKLSVSAGQELKIYVGGEGENTGSGGFNGGGDGDADFCSSGGGASDVRTGSYTLNDRVIVVVAEEEQATVHTHMMVELVED